MATATELQQLYIAYFGRPADPAGLAYWVSSGLSTKSFAAVMFAQPEFQSVNSGLSVETQVNKLYMNLFGRPADASGLLYWTNQINTGQIALASVANDLIFSATNSGAASAADLAALTNKTSTAVSYTAGLLADTDALLAYQPQSNSPWISGAKFAAAVSFMTTATATNIPTAAQITASVGSVGAAGTQGQTFALTTGVDPVASFTGGAGNDTFTATGTTLTAFDALNGGAGTDRLAVTDTTTGGSFAAGLPGGVALTGIEVFDINSVGKIGTVAVSAAAAINQVSTITITANGGTYATGDTQTVVYNGVTLTTDSLATVTLGAAAIAAAINAHVGKTVATSVLGVVTVTGTGGAAFTLTAATSDATNNLLTVATPTTAVAAVTGATAAVFDISGSGYASVTDFTGVSAGGMNLKAAATQNVKLSNSGNGGITIAGGKAVTVVDAGSGAKDVQGSALTTVSVTGGTGAVNVDNLGGIAGTTTSTGTTLTSVNLSGVDANATLKGASLTEVTIGGATTAARTTTITNGTKDHSLTVNAAGTGYDSDGTTERQSVVTDTAAKTITINASAKSSVDVTNNTAMTALNVTGSGAVKLSADMASLQSINASTSTGGVNIGTVHGNTLSITGGAGGDKVTLDTASIAYAVDMGAGDDTVTVTAALANTVAIAGGAGTDILAIDDATATLLTDAIKDGVTGFETLQVGMSTDTADFEVLAFSNLILAAGTAQTVNNISASAAASISVIGDQATSLILNLKTTSGSADVMALNLDHVTASTDIDIADFRAAGVETLNISSNGAATSGGSSVNSVELDSTNTSLKAVTITGSSEFLLAMDGNNESLTVAATIDASGLNAVATLNMTGNNTDLVIKGGVKADVLTGGNGVDTITTNGGNDTVNVSSGNDNITLSAGQETIAFSTLSANGTDADTITGFTKGTNGDIISLDESAVGGGLIDAMTAGTTIFLKFAAGAIGTNDSGTTLTDNTVTVITDRSFASYDALEIELDLENGGTDLADLAVIFLNSTTGKAELYVDGVVGNGATTDEVLLATFTDMTALSDLSGFVAANFVIA